MSVVRFSPTVSPRQGNGPRVLCFAATPEEVTQIARIERIGRDADGRLSGFQRPQIAAHIREIRDYLALPDAMLPNAIVLAFAQRASIGEDGSLVIDVSDGPPGWVVDGQQRLCAALGLRDRAFQFVVSAFLCDDPAELNRQFILINNTRPLAKPLIYELLPGVQGLPQRLSDRAGAALLIEALNYRSDSSLKGQINQQTNPDGILKDTLVQKMLINSLQHGALRDFAGGTDLLHGGVRLVSDFFAAVQDVFRGDWKGHTPKTSRLLHGVGLIAMGYVFDELVIRFGAHSQEEFRQGLVPLVGRTHWTDGEWEFGSERRPWNSLQNTKADYRLVSHLLVRLVRRGGAKVGAVA
ncbi:DGQHR domain-containing protein [Inquilinus limosus]|uniref:DGQHR domain-containing protein DpdB n=1 Tax=Inquilinus limosus TaxID=171674 RepID=UPI003F14B7FD